MRPIGSPPFKQLAWRKIKCKMCPTVFQCSRADREFCGATCRKRHQRKCDAVTAASADPPKLHNMEVPSRATGKPTVITQGKLLRSLKRAEKAVGLKPVKPRKSTTRSKPTRKGGKKK